jgi:cathepsin B
MMFIDSKHKCAESYPKEYCPSIMDAIQKTFDTLLVQDSPEIEAEARSAQLELNPNRPPIPENFDGRIVWKDFLAPVWNQERCGACYSFAAISNLQDKFAIQSLGQVRPSFNPLEPVMCLIEETSITNFYELKTNSEALLKEEHEHIAQACNGNSLYSIGKYLFRFGAVEDSCVPFSHIQKILRKTGSLPLCTSIEGPNQDLCMDNTIAQRGWPIWNYYTVGDKDSPNLIEDLQLDMLKWGPIVMGFMVYDDFINEYDGKSIYKPKPNAVRLGGHAVKVLGWGTENGIKYWICQNSWSSKWGDKGFFKIERGNSMLNMETNHLGLAPELPNTSLARAPKPFSPTLGQSTGKELLERKFYSIDPLNFYPKRLIPLIKAGKLKGDLRPLFDDATLPVTTEFWACKIGTDKFITPSGKMVGVKASINADGWGLIPILVFVIAFALVLLWFHFRR